MTITTAYNQNMPSISKSLLFVKVVNPVREAPLLPGRPNLMQLYPII